MLTRADCEELDAADPLAVYRQAFLLPAGIIYLDGNSLGALPAATPERVAETVSTEWGQGLIGSWNRHDWLHAPNRVGDKIGHLIGAAAGEVLVADSTSVNLFKLLCAGLALRPGRRTILTEAGNFPTDFYMAEGVARMLGVTVRAVPPAELAAAIDADTALVLLCHVHYKTGRRWDMRALTEAAQEKGALVLWDLSHSAGVLAVDLNGCNADLAVGCGYKYLNGGPGAPAYLFMAGRHQDAAFSPLSGWMGHRAPFAFADHYSPGDGIQRFACGTPGILGLAALETTIDLHLTADMDAIEAKAASLGTLFIDLVEQSCGGLEAVSPREPRERGGHVAFKHMHGYAIVQALIERGVIGDFRAPDILRFGLAPLYTSYAEIWDAVAILAEVLDSGVFHAPRFSERATVT